MPPDEDGLEEQREIAGILEQVDDTIRAFNPKLAALTQLKSALTHDLFAGRIRLDKSQLQAVEAQ